MVISAESPQVLFRQQDARLILFLLPLEVVGLLGGAAVSWPASSSARA